MFDLIARKIKDDELLETVKNLRGTDRRLKNQAFVDLRETYAPLILKQYNFVKNLADNQRERNELRDWIETVFIEILLDRGLRLNNIPELKSYIKKMLGFRVNKATARDALGKTPMIKDIENWQAKFRNALKRYHKKYRKRPDLKDNPRDIKDFAEILDVKPQKIPEILKMVGENQIRSIFEEITGSDKGDAELLIDTLQSDEPLPDEALMNKEFMNVFLKEIRSRLKPEEQAAFMIYYHPQEPRMKDPTKEDVASMLSEKLGREFSERQVKYLLDTAKGKLEKSPVLRSLAHTQMINRFKKYAISKYVYFSFSARTEKLVKDILNA